LPELAPVRHPLQPGWASDEAKLLRNSQQLIIA
jgi:hypothetical protein